jgi:hypothetical protein
VENASRSITLIAVPQPLKLRQGKENPTLMLFLAVLALLKNLFRFYKETLVFLLH